MKLFKEDYRGEAITTTNQRQRLKIEKLMWTSLTDYDKVRIELKGILTDKTVYDINVSSKKHNRIQIHKTTIKDAIELIAHLEKEHQIEAEALFIYKYADELIRSKYKQGERAQQVGERTAKLMELSERYAHKYKIPLMMITRDGRIETISIKQ